jgi:hypothetical protein
MLFTVKFFLKDQKNISSSPSFTIPGKFYSSQQEHIFPEINNIRLHPTKIVFKWP